tara:strand:- start:1915 stop:2910 length:996 start_codon:yes stop_codon:yes gene_type:complete
MRKKILTVVGNRPQLIKYDKKLKQVLCYTGQHYDKSLKDVFFKGLKLPKPDYDLGKKTLGEITDGIQEVIKKEKPDYVMVYGDTRSTLAGAMAAYYSNIPIIHIEAGCRSFNDDQIEERIRILVDKITTIHLAPSEECVNRLVEDGHRYIYNVGATQLDTMWDTFPTKKPRDANKYCILTLHRAENTDDKEKLKSIFEALGESKKKIKFYLHPRTKEAIKKFKLKLPSNIKVLKPIPYKKMIHTMAFAEKVITDSGGIQVEAFFLNVPCITLRDETEWQETVDDGWNILTGANKQKILDALKKGKRGKKYNPKIYGIGRAKKKIKVILQSL